MEVNQQLLHIQALYKLSWSKLVHNHINVTMLITTHHSQFNRLYQRKIKMNTHVPTYKVEYISTKLQFIKFAMKWRSGHHRCRFLTLSAVVRLPWPLAVSCELLRELWLRRTSLPSPCCDRSLTWLQISQSHSSHSVRTMLATETTLLLTVTAYTVWLYYLLNQLIYLLLIFCTWLHLFTLI